MSIDKTTWPSEERQGQAYINQRGEDNKMKALKAYRRVKGCVLNVESIGVILIGVPTVYPCIWLRKCGRWPWLVRTMRQIRLTTQMTPMRRAY